MSLQDSWDSGGKSWLAVSLSLLHDISRALSMLSMPKRYTRRPASQPSVRKSILCRENCQYPASADLSSLMYAWSTGERVVVFRSLNRDDWLMFFPKDCLRAGPINLQDLQRLFSLPGGYQASSGVIRVAVEPQWSAAMLSDRRRDKPCNIKELSGCGRLEIHGLCLCGPGWPR